MKKKHNNEAELSKNIMQDVTSEENKERGKKKIKYKLYITLPLIGSACF